MGWAEVDREETGAGQLIGDSRQECGISEEGTKGAEGNKKVVIWNWVMANEKIAKMLSTEQKG